MRLKNISSIEEGNIFLRKYLQKHNEKFAKDPLCSEDAHRPLKNDDLLDNFFARKERRKLSKDPTFQYDGILYQIDPQIASFGMKHFPVTVIDNKGAIEVDYKGKKLAYKKYSEIEPQASIIDRKYIDSWLNKKSRKINKNHPWKL